MSACSLNAAAAADDDDDDDDDAENTVTCTINSQWFYRAASSTAFILWCRPYVLPDIL